VSWTISIGISPDFNGDGAFSCTDIDDLVMQIATNSGNLDYDLTGDGVLDNLDLDAWLAQAGAANLPSGNPYSYGDANLDGVVDVSDFNMWNSFKFTPIAQWCFGDFNADGSIDVSDFNLWNVNKFTTADAAAVPEPSSILMAIMGLGFLGFARRRSQK
jgi:hypothetical protein